MQIRAREKNENYIIIHNIFVVIFFFTGTASNSAILKMASAFFIVLRLLFITESADFLIIIRINSRIAELVLYMAQPHH